MVLSKLTGCLHVSIQETKVIGRRRDDRKDSQESRVSRCGDSGVPEAFV